MSLRRACSSWKVQFSVLLAHWENGEALGLWAKNRMQTAASCCSRRLRGERYRMTRTEEDRTFFSGSHVVVFVSLKTCDDGFAARLRLFVQNWIKWLMSQQPGRKSSAKRTFLARNV